jgi:PAS domain S-box-containing protein
VSGAIAHRLRRASRAAGDEAGRLAALDAYDVLDTLPEPAFDRIVRLAARLLDVPIALISLIDAERQWFKAKYGIDAPETPRASAFCHHTILGDDLMVVPDAAQDDRFRANPLVTGNPHIRFYAGAPLVTSDGFALGTLCAIDRAPRQMSQRESAILTDLADQVVHELDVRAALGEMYQEVSKGRRIARVLQGEGAKLAALLNATRHAVITWDGGDRVLNLNLAAEALFGLSTNEAVGWPIHALISHVSDRAGVSAPETTREGIGRRKDGTEFAIEMAYADWVDADGCSASGAILRDITRRRDAEIQSRKRDDAERTREKLAVLGQMAGGVAHEMNNLLQPVIGLASFELDNLPRDASPAQAETRENLEMVVECGKQMRGIVRRILVFARKDVPDLVELDVPDTLARTLAFVGKLLPPGICIDADLDHGPGGAPVRNHALINATELIEVISNLALNAAHAMKGHGVLAVGLDRVELDEALARLHGVRPGAYFRVSVADTGTGMDAATAAQVFNPFFTTKAVGDGTGLGLSTVYGVLRDWKGAIEVESILGRGTVFTLYIPISALSS